MVEDQQDFENVIPENVAEKGKRIKQYALHYLSTVCPHYEFNIDTIIKLNQAAAIFWSYLTISPYSQVPQNP